MNTTATKALRAGNLCSTFGDRNVSLMPDTIRCAVACVAYLGRAAEEIYRDCQCDVGRASYLHELTAALTAHNRACAETLIRVFWGFAR
jgi:hypothetical protein